MSATAAPPDPLQIGAPETVGETVTSRPRFWLVLAVLVGGAIVLALGAAIVVPQLIAVAEFLSRIQTFPL